MNDENIFNEPMRELILTMSAWKRLMTNAEMMRRDENNSGKSMAGLFILSVMHEAWVDAQKDLKDSERKIKKQMKEKVKE